MANQSQRVICRRVEPATLDAIRDWRRRELIAARELARYVKDARDQGWTWEVIGRALGTSKQAAWERFGGGA